MVIKTIKTEKEFSDWFIKNHKNFGYSKIIRKDIGIFPDFIMEKEGREIRVELETLSSNFLMHKHNKDLVDEVLCIFNDADIGVPTTIVGQLKFNPRLRRISATVEPTTNDILKNALQNGKYRNKSHAIEDAIRNYFGGRKHAK